MEAKKLLVGILMIGSCFMINNYAITIKNNNIYGVYYRISKSWIANYIDNKTCANGLIDKNGSIVWTKIPGFFGDDKPDKVFVEVKSMTGATADSGDVVKNEGCELTVENAGYEKIKIQKGAGC